MFEFLEVEEQVGRAWHRLVGQPGTYARFPEAAIELAAVRNALGVFFRALGGDPAVRVAEAVAERSRHRLSWRQRLAMLDERLAVAKRGPEVLHMPARLDYFPERSLNRDLYFWLAALLSEADGNWADRPSDPLQADLTHLHNVSRAAERVCRRYPGLQGLYRRLCHALLEVRPCRDLPSQEAAVDAAVVALLGGPSPTTKLGQALLSAVLQRGAARNAFQARRGYRRMLPVPVWGDVEADALGPARPAQDHDPGADGAGAGEEGRRLAAERKRHDQSQRDDPLILNRFEKILTWAEMVNVNRATEDEDEDAARRAAQDTDRVSLSPEHRRPTTRLKFDLHLSPSVVDRQPLAEGITYPEWDFRHGAYLADHCRVVEQPAALEGEDWQPDEATRRRIRHVRRQFEALRPRRELQRRQLDGFDLDTDAAVRARCELTASGKGSDQIFEAHRNAARNLAVSILADVSLSTDAWIDNRRVLDVEKEALTVLAHGLAGCGDSFEIKTFTSRRRSLVHIETVKAFDEKLNGAVLRRIAALRPSAYTRIGAAVRHATRLLNRRAGCYRLILLLTDGKPNDVDHYEGRYGIEDTRMAIREARRSGIVVFGITVDKTAREYVPYLFGRGGYAIVEHVARLPSALPMLYRHLTF